MQNLIITLALVLGLLFNCNTANAQVAPKKIKVLNIGMFHMGYTNDATTTEYDEKSEKNLAEIKEINELLAAFQPTIILVEEEVEYQKDLEQAYTSYCKDPSIKTRYHKSETQIIAFETGRLAGTKRIYGIDHKMSYNYNLNDLATEINATKFFKTVAEIERLMQTVDADPEKVGLKKVLSILNTQAAYDFLININADALAFINKGENFEGADEAAKLYHRNLRMFANINKIEMDENDRVLIISGATHAAFFQGFLSRSYVYEVEPVDMYIK